MEANQLSAIPETMLITLWAKATETENGGKLIHDEKAVEMIRKIDYDFSKFKKAAMSQVGCCVRASLIDQETLEFLKNHPDAVVIQDRKSTRLNSSHANISYAVFCLKKKKKLIQRYITD